MMTSGHVAPWFAALAQLHLQWVKLMLCLDQKMNNKNPQGDVSSPLYVSLKRGSHEKKNFIFVPKNIYLLVGSSKDGLFWITLLLAHICALSKLLQSIRQGPLVTCIHVGTWKAIKAYSIWSDKKMCMIDCSFSQKNLSPRGGLKKSILRKNQIEPEVQFNF